MYARNVGPPEKQEEDQKDNNGDPAPESPYSSPQNLLNMKTTLVPFYKKKCEFDRTLIFESRFESGNLNYAVKVSDTMYILVLQNDCHCLGHTQWYYFRVGNTSRGAEVRFNIVNMVKAEKHPR